MADGALHAIVSGRVQGVGFRFFVLGRARRLGLTGSVRNLPDGRVDVLARGAEDELRKLAGALHEGPPLSRVDDVKLQWGVEAPAGSEFTIGY